MDYENITVKAALLKQILQAPFGVKQTFCRTLFYGFLGGLLLPLFVLLMESAALRLPPTPSTLFHLHISNPVHFLLYLFPVATMSLCGYWGFQYATLKHQYRIVKRAEQTLRSIVGTAHDGVMTVDQSRCITFFNKTCEVLFGYKAHEVLGESVEMLLPALFPSGSDLLPLTPPSLASLDTETVGMPKEGSLFPIEVAISPVASSENSLCTIILRDITDRKLNEEKIRHLAYQDSLTELANRRLFDDRLEVALQQAQTHHRHLAVLFLDLDRFKYINDSWGHRSGDMLLAQVAHRLLECVRRGDTVARTGGDEFVVLLPEVTSFEDVEMIAERIVTSMQPAFYLEDHEVFVTFSAGGSIFPEGGETAETLLQNADVALYRAKQEGRNCYRLFHPEMVEQVQQTLTLETNLRKAIANEEFLVYYQPLLETQTKEIMGTEALVRWKHPDSGMISPAYFIPIAEETGLIVEIGLWVLREACRQTREWQMLGFPDLKASVNVSLRQLQQSHFVDDVWQVLEETGLTPECLDIEITESVAMEQIDYTLPVLNALTEMGVKLTMDDFGTGYSSLNYLKHLPIHKVKIDQSFIRSLTSDTRDAAIAKSIITMSHSLNLKVVAEGVETSEQLRFLTQHQCDYVQGYLYSKPVSHNEMQALLYQYQELAQVNAA